MKIAIRILILLIALIIGYAFGNSNRIMLNTKENLSPMAIEEMTDLQYIQFDPLVIISKDDKCGEWGGNTEIINIEREHISNELSALYTYEKIDCSAPYQKKDPVNITNRKRVVLSKYQEHLVVDVILELIKNKLGSENIPSHSGIYHSILLGDSTLLINDYPSNYLSSFDKLKGEILKE